MEASGRLRDGGVVFWAADDPDVRPLQVAMFGWPVRLSRAAATLARLSAAATIPIAATWEAGRIRVVLGEALEPASDDPEEWERRWLSGYCRFLEGVVAADAANLRLDVGLWAALARPD